jgi:hypothetical protein
MTARTSATLGLVMALAVQVAATPPQTCDGRTEQRLDQESYISLTDRVYVYAPDVQSTGGGRGWQRFDLRVLVATYRAPLLLPRGLLKPGDLQKLLSTRPDIKVTTLAVPGHDTGAGKNPSFDSVAVADGERPRRITIRPTRVVPASSGPTHLFLVCSTSG